MVVEPVATMGIVYTSLPLFSFSFMEKVVVYFKHHAQIANMDISRDDVA